MWSVAPVSRIQELDLKQCLSMTWAEKIEWDKCGAFQKGLLEKLEEDDKAEAAVGEAVAIVKGRAGAIAEATYEAVWVPMPFAVPKPKLDAVWAFKKLRSCSH